MLPIEVYIGMFVGTVVGTVLGQLAWDWWKRRRP